MAKFTSSERVEAQKRYECNELAYKAYSDSPDWGVTVTPMTYIRKLFDRDFRVIGPRMFFQNPTQLPIVLIRK